MLQQIQRIILGCCFSLLAAASAQAQIPVTDAASLSQQIQQVAAWAQQIQSMKDQLDQQKFLYQSMNGARGIGQLLNNPALQNTLPDNWKAVYASIQTGGYSGLTGSAKAIRDANAIFGCDGKTGMALTICNRDRNKAAQDKAFSLDAYDAAQRRLTNIQALMGQIDNATDTKTIQDLQVRMQAENAMIQNEQTKLMMFKMMADAESKLIDQQKREADAAHLARRTRLADRLVIPQ